MNALKDLTTASMVAPIQMDRLCVHAMLATHLLPMDIYVRTLMNVWRVHVPVWKEQLVSTLMVLTSASVMQDTEILAMARLVKVCGFELLYNKNMYG